MNEDAHLLTDFFEEAPKLNVKPGVGFYVFIVMFSLYIFAAIMSIYNTPIHLYMNSFPNFYLYVFFLLSLSISFIGFILFILKKKIGWLIISYSCSSSLLQSSFFLIKDIITQGTKEIIFRNYILQLMVVLFFSFLLFILLSKRNLALFQVSKELKWYSVSIGFFVGTAIEVFYLYR